MAKTKKKGNDEGLKFLQSLNIRIMKNQSSLKNDTIKKYGEALYKKLISFEYSTDLSVDELRAFTEENPELFFEYRTSEDGTYIRALINYLFDNQELIGQRVFVRLQHPIIAFYLAKRFPDSDITIGLSPIYSIEYIQYLLNRLQIRNISVCSYNRVFEEKQFDTIINDIRVPLIDEVGKLLFGRYLSDYLDWTKPLWEKKSNRFANAIVDGGHLIEFETDLDESILGYAWFLNHKGLIIDWKKHKSDSVLPGNSRIKYKPFVCRKEKPLEKEEFCSNYFGENINNKLFVGATYSSIDALVLEFWIEERSDPIDWIESNEVFPLRLECIYRYFFKPFLIRVTAETSLFVFDDSAEIELLENIEVLKMELEDTGIDDIGNDIISKAESTMQCVDLVDCEDLLIPEIISIESVVDEVVEIDNQQEQTNETAEREENRQELIEELHEVEIQKTGEPLLEENCIEENHDERQIDEPVVSTEEKNSNLSNLVNELTQQHLIEKQKKDYKDPGVFMGQYIGIVNCFGSAPNYFYNYTPLYQIESDGSLMHIYSHDRQRLLPDSQNENINLYYHSQYAEQTDFMSQHFYDGMLTVLKFDPDTLEHNLIRGELNATGYKVVAEAEYKKGHLKPVSDVGYYQLLPASRLPENWTQSSIIEVDYEKVAINEKILLDCGNGFYAGPYLVQYREVDKKYYIRPRIRENKYVLLGYSSNDCKRTRFESETEYIYCFSINKDVMPVEHDVISDAELLTAFFENFKSTKSGTVLPEATSITDIINDYSDSLFAGKNISENICITRRDRLIQLLHSEESIKTSISTIKQYFEESIKSTDNMDVFSALLDSLYQNKPELFARFQINKLTRSDNSGEVQQGKTEQEYHLKKQQLEDIQSQIDVYHDVKSLEKYHEELKQSIAVYEKHKQQLQDESAVLEKSFEKMLDNFRDRMVGISFDGYMSSMLLNAANRWKKDAEEEHYAQMLVDGSNSVMVKKTQEELVSFLVNLIQKERPQYSHNLIVNLLVCVSQGFLTVFSGDPGCGKTSICNIIARALGINNKEHSRYIPVSVERGWTSKNDFIGYYNPLTKSFEQNNHEVFEGLKLLDYESRNGNSRYPFMILLDEANLSPMEFYWADFMNVCDDRDVHSTINLGKDNVFSIPDTLHFVATINNDHTTQVLSPRLIDRAWVITLPRNKSIEYGEIIPDDMVETIPWKVISETFGVSVLGNDAYPTEIQDLYEGIRSILLDQDIIISPRVEIAIKKYWMAASMVMKDDEYADANTIAMDYAIAQKILPKLSGMGDEYAKWLEKLLEFCNKNGLQNSGAIIQNIISKGNRRMKDYQFFN